MKEQFVPATIAQQLKEKGFDQSCMAYVYTGDTGTNVDQYVYGAISHDGNPRCENYNAYDMSYSLPLWQQVIDWLSDVHNIEVNALRYTYHGGVYQGKCYMWFVAQYDPKYNHELEEDDSHWILNERKAQGYDFKTKREAILAGITEALTLI